MVSSAYGCSNVEISHNYEIFGRKTYSETILGTWIGRLAIPYSLDMNLYDVIKSVTILPSSLVHSLAGLNPVDHVNNYMYYA